jgi:ABC-2 type transport system permease protein
MFWKSTYNEFIKIAAKPRSYIGIGAVTVICGIILFAMHAEGMSMISWLTQPFEQSLSFEGNILNGNLIAFIVLKMLIIHVPLLIALVTGDLISGEGAMGTIRFLLTKPISRTQILFSKYLAGCAYTLVMVLWLALLALVAGKIMFGNGDLVALNSNGLVIFQQDELPWRFFCGLGTAFLSMVMIATLSLTLSCFSENSVGPIVSTMAIIIIFTIIGAIETPALEAIQPYLFTSHMGAWMRFFEDPLPFSKILHSMLVLIFHIAGLLSIAVYKFNRKDILS